ncbi:site-specific DNA-methyltransferase [Paenibacillus sp. FSL H3-0310]|uniref:site-specific DNA-methyltransferase n=1 Tax=Paenibacillus sp. FSL H3-0310 TaxID=2921429 RepID=UPI0030FA1BDA
MDIKIVPIEQINAAVYNPRVDLQPGDPEYEKLRRSLDEFGYVDPIVWNEQTGNMVGGHQRYKVLVNEQSCTELAVSVVNLDPDRERLLNLALNKVSGRWDDEALVQLLNELQEDGADLVLSGFEPEEIRELIVELGDISDIEINDSVVEDDFDVQGALDEIKEPETQRGDIWQLGRHILMCGDTTNAEDVSRLMDGMKANLVVTDPPYNVAVQSDSARLAEAGTSSIMNDDMPADEFAGFLHAVFQNYVTVMLPTAAIYIFHPAFYQRDFENAMNAAGIVRRTQCIWVKNSASFGWSQYRFQHEPVFYGHIKGRAPSWYGDRTQTTIWDISRGDVSKYFHPTQKPLELLTIPIQNSSQRGDTVVDLFGGSGSTMMTCEQLDRSCRTMELDPLFCDVIKLRYQAATGTEPLLLHRVDPVIN